LDNIGDHAPADVLPGGAKGRAVLSR
jgi:hypothetical protein